MFRPFRGQLAGVFPQQDSFALVDLILAFRQNGLHHLLFLLFQIGELNRCRNRKFSIVDPDFQGNRQFIDAEIGGNRTPRKVILCAQSIPAFYPVEVTSTSPVFPDFIRVFQPFQFLDNIVPAPLTNHLGVAQGQHRRLFRGQHFGEGSLQDIGFNNIDPGVVIRKIFLYDTGEFPVCDNGGVLPIMPCQHFVLKSILIRFNLSDNGRDQNAILRNTLYQIVEPVALIQPEGVPTKTTDGLR